MSTDSEPDSRNPGDVRERPGNESGHTPMYLGLLSHATIMIRYCCWLWYLSCLLLSTRQTAPSLQFHPKPTWGETCTSME